MQSVLAQLFNRLRQRACHPLHWHWHLQCRLITQRHRSYCHNINNTAARNASTTTASHQNCQRHDGTPTMTTTKPAFPIKAFAPVNGKPDFCSLQQLKSQTCQCAVAITSTPGGGNHGLLGAFMNDPECSLIRNNGTAWNALFTLVFKLQSQLVPLATKSPKSSTITVMLTLPNTTPASPSCPKLRNQCQQL